MTVEGVATHIQRRTLTEIVVVPDHDDRTTSPEFRKSVQRLKDDGHYKCWVTGLREGDKNPDGADVKLQVHHFACEWSLANDCDFAKLKEFCEEWDPYGYGKLLRNIPITSVDDVRNCLVLSQEYHTGGMTDGVANGIHQITFPAWISQKLAKKGCSPIPDDTEELQEDINGH